MLSSSDDFSVATPDETNGQEFEFFLTYEINYFAQHDNTNKLVGNYWKCGCCFDCCSIINSAQSNNKSQ